MRNAVGVALGLILCGGVTGLAIDLRDTQSRTRSDAQRSATERASLAGALIDSMFQNSYRSSAASVLPVSRARVTPAEVRAISNATPLGAVLGPQGKVLAAWPPLSAFLAAVIQHDPSVRAAIAGRRNGLSNLLAPAGMPPGFLSATSYQTPFGRRVKIHWVRADAMRAMLAQYLRYVAHYPGAHVYLLDGNNQIIGSNGGSQSSAAADPATATQARGMFVAVSRLHVAPWRVLYTVPTKALYASNGYEAALSFLLLGGFGMAALVCVFLLVRLSSRSSALAKANVELAARSAEAEQANNAKSQFLATMSHELRTPLNAIIGFADLMHDGRLGPVSEQHRESLDDIRGSARHLLDLINEVLDLARIESGRIMLDIQSIDPVQVVSSAVDSLRSLAAERNLAVTMEAQSIDNVLLDPARLRQVVLNYLSNAIKFTPEGGLVQVRVLRELDELVLEVIDTGSGIALEDQARVFGEFEQLHGAAYGGTGLGLAVTKRIIEAQGGSVGVRSAPGHGCTFYARLPVTTVPAPAPAPEMPESRELALSGFAAR
ncbi:MAG: sensor histidine kinase [Solirubrobacteraceae bacterium]